MNTRIYKAIWTLFGACLRTVFGSIAIGSVTWVAFGQLHAADGARWEEIGRQDGVVVELRASENDDEHTQFRGTGNIEAGIGHIFAVVHDVSQFTKWAYRCSEAELLEEMNRHELWIYIRLDAPWPVSDRDAVLLGKGTVITPGKQMTATFEAVPSKRKAHVEDVVRFPLLKGRYTLTALSDRLTRVRYQVEVDPGGWLPRWLGDMANKDMPINTILNLRRQVKATANQYQAFIAKLPTEVPDKSSKQVEASSVKPSVNTEPPQ